MISSDLCEKIKTIKKKVLVGIKLSDTELIDLMTSTYVFLGYDQSIARFLAKKEFDYMKKNKLD